MNNQLIPKINADVYDKYKKGIENLPYEPVDVSSRMYYNIIYKAFQDTYPLVNINSEQINISMNTEYNKLNISVTLTDELADEIGTTYAERFI